MKKNEKIIALLGSTRGEKTVTESIINYMIGKVKDKNVSIEKYRAYQIFNDEKRLDIFINSLRTSDLLIICSPVYVHSLPYPLIVVMEKLAGRLNREFWANKQMLSIIHNGYPQAIQRKASMEICENFAGEVGLEWLGGIGFGGSPIIDGRALEEVGSFTKWMRKALDELILTTLDGIPVSERAYKYADKHFPSIPLWILKILMNLKLKQQARKEGVNIYQQPYLDDVSN